MFFCHKNEKDICAQWRFLFIGIITFLSVSQTVWADLLPGSTYPEQISKALSGEKPRPIRQAPEVVAPKPAPEPDVSEAEKIKFDLNEITVTGNTVYSTAQLKKLWQDKLHTTITVAELFKILELISNFYRNNCYILSRAVLPPQQIENGVVQVVVIEGF